MPEKNVLIIGLMLILFGAFEFNDSYAQQPRSGQAYSAYSLNPDLCAFMLRKGKESFSRGRYTEAKELFRKAILADPNSQKSWSYYDLAQMYSVAEQFKNHGRIVQSSAPPAEQTMEMAQPQPAQPIPSAPEKASALKLPKRR
jgi:tetratricopeptide (TPR) repeat protein